MEKYQLNINNPFQITDRDIQLTEQIAPLTFYYNYDEVKHLEYGNKVLLPKTILNKLSVYDNLLFPLTFKMNDIIFGIHEIIEDIDTIYIPTDIATKLNINEPIIQELFFLNIEIEKGTFIKLKPHQSKFYNVINTKEFLEHNLKKLFTHLKKNDTIKLPYHNDILYFDIIETKPSDIISIIDTDIEVDFDLAHDYVEPPKKTNVKFSFKMPLNKNTKNTKNTNNKDNKNQNDYNFKPFSGKGRKLNN